jgi:cytidylate kinase
MIVTIDGPAGAGKSSAARALAERLGFAFLDTGAMYRAVALAASAAGVALDNHAALAGLVQGLRLEMPPDGRVVLDGVDVSAAIRTPAVSQGASRVAASPAVRRQLVHLQRQIPQGRDMVCEGRDQGTVAFPDAGCKFFLIADPEERVRRRAAQMQGRDEVVDLPALRQEQAERDARDAERDVAPMRPAEDAVILDSTNLTLDEVIARMEAEVRRRLSAGRAG